MAMRRRPLADRRPNAPRDGFQAEPVLVAGEDFDRAVGMFGGFLGDGVFKVFLNAAAASGEADFGFLGRGSWIDIPQVIALACGPAPAGYARWTLSLLEEKVVELNIVEKASDNTIGRTLKKTFSSRISNSNG